MTQLEGLAKLEDRFKKAYFKLLEKIGYREFRIEQVEEFLKEIGLKNTNEVLSELRQVNLINVKKDPDDYRKSIYTFILDTEKNNVITKDKLFSLLKNGADLIRTSVDYKVLMVLLFYKALNDKWMLKFNEHKNKVKSDKMAYILANTGYYKLYDNEADKLYTWQEVTKSKETIKELSNALRKIADLNREKFGELEKLLEVLGFSGFINEDNLHLLESLVNLFGTLDFSQLEQDIIGDAYQWILSYFAPQKAKEGEVYTPKEISNLIVNLLDIQEGESILDPASGSCSMLIEAYTILRKQLNKQKPNINLYGQERNEIMGIVGKLNFILHDIDNFKVYIGDSLKNPRFPSQVDYVIANPPWNLDGYGEETFKDTPDVQKIYKTFVDNGFPTNQSADLAWVQLMLYFAQKKVGVVLDSGALFRGGKEKYIRQALIEKDFAQAVILLPEKLFYNTQAPGIIFVLNKNKPQIQKNKILFINASQNFEKHPDVRKLNILNLQNIEKIVNAYKEFKDIDNFSLVTDIEEVRKNDFNLNVSLYVNPLVQGEEIDLEKEFMELKELEDQEKKLLQEVYGYIHGVIEAGKEV